MSGRTLAALAAVIASACGDGRVGVSRTGDRPTPAAGDRGLCADVGDLRVCWDARDGTPSLHERPLPGGPAVSRAGWRCAGSGRDRRCADRAADAGAFTCEGDRCVQRHARLPDDAEWSCAASAGAAVCSGGDGAAGPPGTLGARGWFCGRRPGGARVCVDLSPDFPDARPSGWRCRYEGEGAPSRICERQDGVHNLADRCSSAAPCVDGARCVEGRCVPAQAPRPSCWVDGDCPGGACRFGTCLPEGA